MKFCQYCGKEIIKQPTHSKKYFESMKYCSSKCFGSAIKKPIVKKEPKNIPGYCSRKFSHPLYDAWRNIKRRCYYTKSKHYKNYGGRGVEVCEEWRNSFNSFLTWALENGWQEGLTIDRKDNDGNYEPLNCRWITRGEQLLNRRNNRCVTYNGETKTAKEWSVMLSISYTSFLRRLNKWGDLERVFNEPRHENCVRVS